jgi:CBS domain containing-hemolysin-like protein
LFGKINEDEYWVDGKCDLETFFALYDMEQEDENFESNTVGGWVTERYGVIPTVGETFRFKCLEIKVVKVTQQKVLKIRSLKLSGEYEDEEE